MAWLSLGASTAQAAACGAAATPLLQAICADGSARGGYAALESELAAALERLSPEGQEILRKGETQWSQRVAAACLDHLDATSEGHDWSDAPLHHCLTRFIRDRTEFLKNQGITKGNFTWQDVEDIKTVYCVGQPDAATNVITLSGVSVRIDAPKSEAIDRWNQQVDDGGINPDAPDEPCESSGETEDVTRVSYADGDFVGLVSSTFHCYRSMPHCTYQEGSRFELVPQGRAVTAADVFSDGTGWQSFVAKRLYAGYLEAASEVRQTEASFEERAAETSFWTIDDRTLTYGFGQYDLDGYANANFEVTFTWEELRPYLRADLPFHPDFD